MTKIFSAEACRIPELRPEINGEIVFGLQPNYAKYAGQQPMRFVMPASQLTELDDDDLILSCGSTGTITSTMAEPRPVVSLSLA